MRFVRDGSWMIETHCPNCEQDEAFEIGCDHVRGPGVNGIGWNGDFTKNCACPFIGGEDFVTRVIEDIYYSTNGW